MQSLLVHILDFLFPPSPESLKLRKLSPEEILKTFPTALPTPFSFITSVFSYKDPLVAELIWSIKYKKDKHSIECGAFTLFEKLKGKKAVLIPIPISKKRRRERGFNQCELLIDEIIKLDTENNLEKRYDILFRAKDGGEQKLKDRSGRLENKNIFSVTKVAVDRPIIIIDDVTTTGSTLNEARESLLSSGYTNITALTLAH